MSALRDTPEEFELSGGWLCHLRSGHSFRVGEDDHVQIRAACNCVLLAVRPEQERDVPDPLALVQAPAGGAADPRPHPPEDRARRALQHRRIAPRSP